MKKLLIGALGAAAFSAVASGQTLLWDNGPFITGTGCGGADASSIEPPSTLFGNSTLHGTFGQADDFTVPSGEEWTLTELVWRNYQTNTAPTDPITEAYVEVYEGVPGEGGTLIAGDMTTNRIISSEFSGVYRDNGDASCARAIKDVTVDMSFVPPLGEGQYFIHFQSAGVGTSGPWANHKVPRGASSNPIGAEDNSRLFSGGVWTENFEANTNASWDYPFMLFGSGGGGGVTLELSGACPGSVTASVSGATPGGNVAFIYAFGTGSVNIPPGNPCAGTELGLNSSATLLGTDRADANGNASLSGNAPASACGRVFVQALDVSSCSTSNVEQVQ